MFKLLSFYLLLFFINNIDISATQSCDIYSQCNICASNNCAWCTSNQTCQPLSASSTNCGCVKTSTTEGSQCSTQSCESYNLCYGCVAGGCGWCEETQQCIESKPLNTPIAGPCTSGDCSDLKCWKNKMSNDYPATKCTNSICSSFPDCYDCVANGCAWCEGAQQCYPSNNDGSDVCGEGIYCNNTKQCLKNTYGSSYYNTKCPQTSCSQMRNCRPCLNSGCGWCDSTQTCQPITTDGSESCANDGCANSTSCFKNFLSSNSYVDKCAVVNCNTISNCKDCASQGCGWCESTQSCLPISKDSEEVCGTSYCPDQDMCLKTNIGTLSNVTKCTGVKCSSFSSDCYVCVRNGCGWCSKTQQCLPSSVPGDNGPCTGDCDPSDGCWKHISLASNPIYQLSKCSPRRCNSITDCATCTKEGCGWCAWSNTCSEAQFFPNNETQSPGPCPTGTCQNQEKCWKTDVSQQCGNAIATCSPAGNCKACVTTPGANCGWCHTEKICGELTNDGNGVCSNCNQNPWNIVSTSDNCFDCNFNQCPIGTCNFTTGSCICPPNYYGPTCEIFCSSTANCSGSGQCTFDRFCDYSCSCDPYYYGNTCQYYCNSAVNCSSHGECVNVTNSNGPNAMQCVCEHKWEYNNGTNCSFCPPPYFGDACEICCDESVNCTNNGNCVNCTCVCFDTYSGEDCSKFIGIYPIHAWELIAGLFGGLAIVTVVTCILISSQLTKLNSEDFPGIIILSKFTNIISIGVSIVAYGQLIVYAFKPPVSWLPDTGSGNSTSIPDTSPSTIHLPFHITIPDISYTIYFWAVIGACIFFFLSSLIVILAARFAKSLTHPVHAFFLDVVLTCVWPGIGSGLYFPIMEILFSAFNCKYEPHSPEMHLISDPNIVCWKYDHFVLMGCASLGIVLYYPLSLRILPLSQSMKEHYEYYENHIVYQPKFLIFEAQAKLLILLSKMFFTSHFDNYELYTSVSLMVCIIILFLLTLLMRPCVSSGKVNLWRCVGYVMVICAVAANILSLYMPSSSYLPSFILLSSWVFIVFVSIFLHRAIFLSKSTLSKYWSMSNSVRGRSEYTPLLINQTLNIQGD